MKKNLVVITLTDRDKDVFEDLEGDFVRKGIKPDECLERTFKEVLNYMLDPSGDNINQEYSPRERKICSRIRGMIDSKQPNEQILMSYINSNRMEITADLNKKVGEYPDAIKEKTSDELFEEEVSFKAMDLRVEIDAIGGGRNFKDFYFFNFYFLK